GFPAPRRSRLLTAVEHEDAAIPNGSPGFVAIPAGDAADLLPAAHVDPRLPGPIAAEVGQPEVEAIADRLERLPVAPDVRPLAEGRERGMRRRQPCAPVP